MSSNFSAAEFLDIPNRHREARRLLRLYLVYRLILAGIFTLLLFVDFKPFAWSLPTLELHTLAILFYLGLTLISFSLCQCDITNSDTEYSFAIFADSIFIAVLIYASNGPSSGLGMLLGVSIAIAATGMTGKTALLAASIASLSMLIETFYSVDTGLQPNTAYTEAAILGLAYFAIAMLAHELSSRAVVSEALVKKQGVDIAKLTQINEYVIQQIQTGVIVLDAQQKIRMLNDAAWDLIGMPDVAIGHPLQNISVPVFKVFFSWQEQPSHRTYNLHTAPRGDNLQAQFSVIGEDGNQGTLIFIEDASKAAVAAQQIKLASLGRLVASIAHEIRNPLGAISHASQLLEESPDIQATDKRMIEIIQNNSDRLNDVIENVLTLSRRHAPKPEKININDYLTKLIKEFTDSSALTKQQVAWHTASPETVVDVDKSQLMQIINTLLENAIRHFPGALEKLRVSILAGVEDKSAARFIEITDNGMGIVPDVANKIFDPFFTTKNDGTGLGLYVVKELCDSNNIKIAYQAVTGGGSCFKLRFSNPDFLSKLPPVDYNIDQG